MWSTCTRFQQSQMELWHNSWGNNPYQSLVFKANLLSVNHWLRFFLAVKFCYILTITAKKNCPNSWGLFIVALSSENIFISLLIWGDERKAWKSSVSSITLISKLYLSDLWEHFLRIKITKKVSWVEMLVFFFFFYLDVWCQLL